MISQSQFRKTRVKRDALLAAEMFEQGDFEAGWQLYKNRHYITLENGRKLNGTFWDGQDLTGKSIALLYEQGLGEQILFSSMVEEVAGLASDVVVEVDTRLVKLFKRSFKHLSNVYVVPFICPWHSMVQTADYYCPIGNVGTILRTSVEKFRKTPWLKADPNLVSKYADYSSYIGLSWTSSAQFHAGNKSIPFGLLKPLMKAKPCISLQYGDHKEPICRVPKLDTTQDVDSVAAAVMGCDKIVTISSYLGHLAGALGKTAYVFVPKESGRHWYWTKRENKSIWYNSVYVINQEVDQNWQPTIEDFTKKLLTNNLN